ncbi:2'-5' RNA ligase family protein [Pseudofrancisella aestuarii]|uniref:2'-5' RNA ligase family protein n=1 Tax=Pseudofrancisella aestuarii TaxID=2670347 RepID=A0ABV9TA19_9GAMM|nr:2'-5' RNA ligase family protein [Pseudofrancisella aestuarii]
MFKKVIVILLITVSFISVSFSSSFKEYDIHLIPSKEVTLYIKDFNEFLDSKGLLKKYNITPFIINHPAHITLYLTGFSPEKIPFIEENIKNITQNISEFNIELTNINVNNSGFIMLDVENSNELKLFSDTVVSSLSQYRNNEYPIPEWVKYYPQKNKSFTKYGSPNTFSEFTPHFSIMAISLDDEQQKQNFIKDMSNAIAEFRARPIKAKIVAISLGEVDKNGQIIEELLTIPLKQNSNKNIVNHKRGENYA